MGVRRLGRSTTSSTRSGRTCFRCGRSRCIGHVARRLVARCMWHGPYVSSVRPLVPHSSRDLPAAFEPDPMRSASPWDLTRFPCRRHGRSLVGADRSHRRLVTPGSPAQQVMWGLVHISKYRGDVLNPALAASGVGVLQIVVENSLTDDYWCAPLRSGRPPPVWPAALADATRDVYLGCLCVCASAPMRARSCQFVCVCARACACRWIHRSIDRSISIPSGAARRRCRSVRRCVSGAGPAPALAQHWPGTGLARHWHWPGTGTGPAPALARPVSPGRRSSTTLCSPAPFPCVPCPR
jgi:hypothetical protein